MQDNSMSTVQPKAAFAWTVMTQRPKIEPHYDYGADLEKELQYNPETQMALNGNVEMAKTYRIVSSSLYDDSDPKWVD